MAGSQSLIPLLVLAVAGVLIRAGAAATTLIWFDEATRGVMGRDILHGHFPFFMYGQSFMGAIDGYSHAVAFALLSDSVATLRTLAVLVSLGHVAMVGVLASRVFGNGRWAIAVALVPSPFLLKWAGDARLAYSLLLVLTPVCLMLAMSAVEGRSPASRTRALLVLAFVGGLCWWVNLLFTPVLAACAVTLLLGWPRLGRTAILAPFAFLLGSAPVWLFAAVHGRIPTVSVPLATRRTIIEHARNLVTNALPTVIGVPHGVPVTRAIWPVALVVFGTGVQLALGDRRADRAGRLLLALTTAIPLATVLITERGQALATEDPRYLLTVLAILPVLLGGALARIARHRPAWAGAAVAGLVLAHVAGVAVAYPELRSTDGWRTARDALARRSAVAGMLAGRGLTEVYTHDPDVINFVSGGRVTVSHFYLADDTVRAAEVDAASHVAYLAPEHIPAGFLESLTAAGIHYEREETSLGPLLTGFHLDPGRLHEIPPNAWTATASVRPELAAHTIDRDASTRWRTTGRPAGAWLQVDLGRVHPVGMVAWLPGTYQEVPLGFRLDTSLDGIRWMVAREVPIYYGPLYWAAGHPMGRVRWGRVEVHFPARPARYVRVTHIGQDERFPWTVRELFVYEASDAAPDPFIDPPTAAEALLAMGARRVYADHGEGPRLAQAARRPLIVTPDDVPVDRYGLTPPLERLPLLAPALDSAVAFPVGASSGPAIEAALRSAGVGFTSTDAGGYRLLGRLEPVLPPSRIALTVPVRVTAEPVGDDPRAAVDGQVETRWSTRVPQAPGQWFEVELDVPTELSGVELELGGAVLEYPRRLSVQIARDARWLDMNATIRWLGPLVWTGTHVLRAGVERVVVTFPPTRVRAVRLVQTGQEGFYPWSVAELHLLAP